MKEKKPLLLPLSRQFAIIFTIFALLTTSIILYGAYDYSKLQTTYMNKSLKSYSAQLAKTTRETYGSYENICYSIAYSQVVQDYLTGKSDAVSYSSYQALDATLSSTAYLSPYITDIAVYGDDGVFASLCSSRASYAPFDQVLSKSRFPYSYSGIANIDGISCHILAMPIYALSGVEKQKNKNKRLGILFLAIDAETLLTNSVGEKDRDYDPLIILTNPKDELIYGKPALYKTLKSAGQKKSFFELHAESDSGKVYEVSRYTIPSIGHTLYVLIDKSQVTRQVFRISSRLILGTLAILLLVLVFLALLYRPLIRSLKELTNFMKTISSGDQRRLREGAMIRRGLLGSREIDDIYTSFNDMLTQTDKLNHTIFDTYTRMYELEANNRKTEIAFLRSQINPHFLYNTLTMICGMAAENMCDKIICVTGALSSIFRYSIKGSERVTLREEMRIVDSYLCIQKERFEDRFKVKYDFSDDAYDCLIPKMVIQPLVENAIVHGLEHRIEKGTLLIGAGRNPEHGYLAIWIYDNGVGMPEQTLKRLRAEMAAPVMRVKEYPPPKKIPNSGEDGHSDGLGILNVNSRMVLYYGEEYSLILDSEEGVGTNVQLRVPFLTETTDTSQTRAEDGYST